MKKLLAVLLVLAAVLGSGLYWLSGSLHELIEQGIEHYGSAMTQARVSVEEVEVAAASGRGVIRKLVIGNPPGFKTAHALKVDRIDIDVDMATVARDVIVIRVAIVDGPDVIYEKGGSLTNFDALLNNIASYLGPASGKKSDRDTRLIVEELTICNARTQASAPFMAGKRVSVPLPDISLKNLGATQGGLTPGELGQEIARALSARLSVAANFDRLQKSLGDPSGALRTSVKDSPR